MTGVPTMKTPRLVIIGLSFLVFPSCVDNREATRRLQQATHAASEHTKNAIGDADTSIVAIREQVEDLIPAIEERDLERLKAACGELNALLETNALRCYYRAFAIELQSGPASAKEYIGEELSNPARSDDEKRLLRALKAYFDAKGTISTKDAALMVVAIALEIKIGHGRGAILVVPFMDDPGEAFSGSEEGGLFSDQMGGSGAISSTQESE